MPLIRDHFYGVAYLIELRMQPIHRLAQTHDESAHRLFRLIVGMRKVARARD